MAQETLLLDVALSAPAEQKPGTALLLEAGQVVDRYAVKERLGVGGMAEVWAVQHQTLGTWHALKVLLRASGALRQRLLAEGQAQARLVHSNILPVRDILDLAGTPALLMPLIEGPALDRLLRHHRPTADEAVAIFRGVLAGVGHAHGAGVIHRDLKPANVLIRLHRGRVVPLVADFGLARQQGGTRLTAIGTVMGTPAYAAPEQLADAASADARADIFSLGALFTELLTGRLPFPGGSLEEIRAAHRAPPDLAGVPAALLPLLTSMLHPEPAQRPGSCAVVEAALPDIDAPGGGLVQAVRRLLPARPRQASTAPRTVPNNLPGARDRFIGRRGELTALRERLTSGRLLTVVGTGGAGKTRLCKELGRAVLADWPGGVWWVDLSESRTLFDVLRAIARAMSVTLMEISVEAVGRLLADRGRCLVIFDNFEQLVALAPDSVSVWLDQLSEAAFLVTSRRPLRLRGEQIFSLSPLSVDDGVTLFVDRAAALHQGYMLQPEEEADVRTLVDRLDGLPLAIELAAARARMMRPARLLKRLSRRLDFLASRSLELPERQRTLRATLEWSWELLSEAERATLAQCSVFEGGFTVEAAEAIIDLSGVDGTPWTEDIIAELLDRSLLVSTVSEATRQTRLTMLVSIQAFAREKCGDDHALRRRHGVWFARLGTRASIKSLQLQEDSPTYLSFLQETENVQAAARWAMARSEQELTCWSLFAMQEQTFAQGGFSVLQGLISRVIDGWQGPTDENHVRLVWIQGLLTSVAGAEDGAVALYEQALALCERLGASGRFMEASVRHSIGYLCYRMGRYEDAERHLSAGMVLVEPCPPDELPGKAILLDGMANLYRRTGRVEESLPLYHEAIGIGRSINSVPAHTLNNAAMAYHILGQVQRAIATLQEALQISRRKGSARLEAVILSNLAIFERDPMKSLVWLEEAHDCAKQSQGVRGLIGWYQDVGDIKRIIGRLAEARADLDAGITLAKKSGQLSTLVGLYASLAEVVYLAEAPEDAQRRCAAWLAEVAGRNFHREEAVLSTILGRLARTRGDLDRAAEHFRASLALFEKLRFRFKTTQARMNLWEVDVIRGEPGADTEDGVIVSEIEALTALNARRELYIEWWCVRGRLAQHQKDAGQLAQIQALLRAQMAALPYLPSHRLRREAQALGVSYSQPGEPSTS